MMPKGGQPLPDLTVTQAVFGERPRGGRPALIDAASGRTVTYAELTSLVGSAAAGLRRDGYGRGTVIAVHLPDTPEVAVALHAVIAAGATAMPVRPTDTAEAMHRQLVETGARAVITWPVLVDIAIDAARDTRAERILSFGAEPDVEPFSRLFSGRPAMPQPRLAPGRDVALATYTRGTTGPPKLVRLTHRNLVSAFTQQYAETDTVLSAVPLTDVIGFSAVLNPALRAGAIVVTRAGAGRHDLLRALQERAVTVALLTPQQVEVLAYDREVARYNLRALRSIISTGGPLKPEVARACTERLRCPVRQAYGLAESAGLTHLNHRAAEEGTLDSVGQGLPDVQWRITVAGRDQPAYQQGELWLSGPMVAGGGWLPTGDVAFADEHGRVYVMGRLNEVAPEPLEGVPAVLAAHPAVLDVVVVPVPDPALGLVPHAFVVRREPATEAELLSFVNEQVPAYQRLHAVHLVEKIPRTAEGKVLRRALIDAARGEQ